MKWLILLFLMALLLPLGAQLRTHYIPRPALRQARVHRRIWTYQRPRWAVAVAIVRVR